MNLNATLFGQMITFAIFIWFTVKYVWPPLTKALEERRKKIADGLAAAEHAAHELEMAQVKGREIIQEAKTQAASVVEQANLRAHRIDEEAKAKALETSIRMKQIADDEIKQKQQQAKEDLQKNFASLVVSATEQIIKQKMDVNTNSDLLRSLEDEIVQS